MKTQKGFSFIQITSNIQKLYKIYCFQRNSVKIFFLRSFRAYNLNISMETLQTNVRILFLSLIFSLLSMWCVFSECVRTVVCSTLTVVQQYIESCPAPRTKPSQDQTSLIIELTVYCKLSTLDFHQIRSEQKISF